MLMLITLKQANNPRENQDFKCFFSEANKLKIIMEAEADAEARAMKGISTMAKYCVMF